jgi:hypothetical protein
MVAFIWEVRPLLALIVIEPINGEIGSDAAGSTNSSGFTKELVAVKKPETALVPPPAGDAAFLHVGGNGGGGGGVGGAEGGWQRPSQSTMYSTYT